jgi:ribonuclease J
LLREDIPIVASPESIIIMKGRQDIGISSHEKDTAYFSPRQPTDDLGLYLSSIASASYQGRDFCCTEEPSEALTAFISRKPGQDGRRAKKLDPGNCCSYDNAAFPFEISAYPVAPRSSWPPPTILRGDTTVAYTGDFRLHGKKRRFHA